MSTPAQVARRVKRDLARLARPAGEFDASRYFRGERDLGFYNTGTRAVREMAKAIQREHQGTWTVEDAMACADLLVIDRHLEVKGVAIELVARYHREFTSTLLTRWKRWLAAYSSNWATTDAICGYLIGPLLLQNPRLATRVASWSGDASMWVRRASAVGLIAPIRRRGVGLALGYAVATRLQSDREDLIQKAVGWMLREAGKVDPARLERYLRSRGTRVPRVTLRYAIERLPINKRRALLKATRRG